MLAKINVISKLILTPKEIEIIAQEITSQGLEMHDLDDASEYLTTTIFYKGSTLIICVNIPRLLPSTFKKVIIEPLPLSNRTVKLAYKTAFINQHEIMAITSRCLENSGVTICERKQLVDISDDPCLAPLLREEHGHCNILEKPPATETRTIAPGTLLVITVHQDVTINSTCGINTRTLTGIHLVTFQNCSLYVKNELYENFELRFYQPTILPLQPLRIKTLHVDRHINISELHELNMQNRQYLETVDWKHQLGFVSLSSVITLVFILLACGIIKYWRYSKLGDCSGRAILKGGRVKHETSPAAPNVESPAPAGPTYISTETTQSATSERDTIRNVEASGINTIETHATGRTSLLGARSAHLGR